MQATDKVEQRPAPAIEPPDHHDVELAAACRFEHGFTFRPHVGAGADVAALHGDGPAWRRRAWCVVASAAFADRWRILRALLRAIEQRGGTVNALRYDRGFDVTLLGSEFAMSCSEPEQRVRVRLTREELKARASWETCDYKTVTERAGELRIRANRGKDRPKDFRDIADRPLEVQLNDVIVWLLESSITVEKRDRRAEEARLRAEEERRRQRGGAAPLGS